MVVSNIPALRLETFLGKALNKCLGVDKYFNGFFKANAGFFFNSAIFWTISILSRNKKRERSTSPNKFESALNFEPFTFSNSIAAAPFS